MMFRQNYRSRSLVAVLLTAVVVLRFEGSAVAQDESPDQAVAAQPAERADEPADVQTEPSSDAATSIAADSESTEAADAARRTIDEQEAETERLRESARKSAMAGLLVLSLICIVFLVLIVLVALWARRIRMLTRQPLPELRPGDPLWYLRKGKGSDSSDIAELTDGGSSHGES
jgi:cobalamin biosynthesis Mg chelatase CobN